LLHQCLSCDRRACALISVRSSSLQRWSSHVNAVLESSSHLLDSEAEMSSYVQFNSLFELAADSVTLGYAAIAHTAGKIEANLRRR
jgi:hypothetical protein